ncbi:efflux transporter outer membrane subunit [Hymenobacter sp. BT188]|uniref:efflux transporter outer membrane subunit n=1 Tax=Hymenobacter sp. BT188 TaxID=2763504 RepID=UPI0016519C20|nr:efflux transporter outer membrane subunit [Hymenobacter sp. BT188]MBC6605757.1 efflux transporter outer membrane subunit [Hymenobacter sp. BT188]
MNPLITSNNSSFSGRARPWLALVAGLLLVSSCQVSQPIARQNLPPAPATFAGAGSDTSSIAAIPWHQFFADPRLVGLLDTALQANPDLLIALQRVEVARANVRIARGALLPFVDAGGSVSVDRFPPNGTRGPNTTNDGRAIPTPTTDYFLGLTSSWELDIWGRLRSRRKAAIARLLATEQGRRLVQTALVAQVASLYYELLALDTQNVVIGKNLRLQERALEIVKLQKLGGRATELAVQQFTAQLLRTQSLKAVVSQNIIRAENEINRLLGRYPQPIRRGRPIREQELPAVVVAGLPATMLLRRPDVQRAELELVATRADVSAARAAFLPALTLSPYVGLNAYKSSLLFATPSSLALGALANLSAPLLNRNFLKATLTQATAQQQAAYYGYQQAVQKGFQEVTTSLRGVENYRCVYELQEQEVVALTKAVEISNDLYTASYATYLEVITAQRSALEAELNLANTRREQFLLLIELYRALGGGWSATPVSE